VAGGMQGPRLVEAQSRYGAGITSLKNWQALVVLMVAGEVSDRGAQGPARFVAVWSEPSSHVKVMELLVTPYDREMLETVVA